jgi:hypothetical protein
MKEILNFTGKRSLYKNYIIKQSLENEYKDDKVIKILSKEVVELIMRFMK